VKLNQECDLQSPVHQNSFKNHFRTEKIN
jgi:hypothetical protein